MRTKIQFSGVLVALFSKLILVANYVTAYTQVFSQNFGTSTSGCSPSSGSFFWENMSGTIISACDTSCSFDSSSTIASTLSIIDDAYTFKFSISETRYSQIGIDITFVSSLPNLTLQLLDEPSITTPLISDIPELFEKGTLTCSSIVGGSSLTLINASVRSNINIASNQGSLVVSKISPSQVIGIRTLRLWVNCAENCLTCASPSYCSICIEGFERHTVTVNSQEITVCEVIENCPANCSQCYTLQGVTTCVRCDGGYNLQSNACIAYVASSPPCGVDQYPESDGICYAYTNNSYYYQRGSSGVTSFTPVKKTKYLCPSFLTLIVLDYYNYNLFRCGCVVSTHCTKCYSDIGCNDCSGDYYRDSWYDSCQSCTNTHCNASDCSSTGCAACSAGYTLGSKNICVSNCDSTLNCDVCTTTSGPCTVCKAGYKFDLSNACVAFTCQANETLDYSTNSCVCIPGFTLNASNVCTAQTTPNCGTNQYIDAAANVCICKPGYTMDANSVCWVTPVCGVNEVLNTSIVQCECVTNYARDNSGVCVLSAQPISGVISQKTETNGFTIILDCKTNLQMYAGQDMQQVLNLSMQSGLTDFNYSITKIEGTQVQILLNPNVTLKGEVALVHFTDATFTSSNNLSTQDYSLELSYYIVLSDSQKQANDATNTAAEITVVAIITTIIPIAIFSNFYVLINTIDLTAFLYYLLFVDVRYPSNVLTFYGFFQNFQFPFIPDLFLNIISQDYSQEAAKPFKENATQRYFLSNSGQSISIVIYILAIYFVGKLFSFVSIPKVQNYLKRAMYETWEYSAFFDMVWSLYIYFLIGALLQLQTYDFEEDHYILNYTLHSIFGLLVIVVAPLGVTLLLHMKKNMKSDQEFKAKFGTLIGGLVLFDDEPVEGRREYWQMKLSKMYMGVLYLRKVAFSIVLVFLTEFTYLQLYAFSAMNVIVLVYFLYIMPLESKWENIKNAVGEIVLIIVQICVMFLVEDNKEDSEDNRYNLGWVIIGFSGFIMGWHTIQLVTEMVKSMYDSIKGLLCKKPATDSAKVHVIGAEDAPLQEKTATPINFPMEQVDLSNSEASPQPKSLLSNVSTQRFSEKAETIKESPTRRKKTTILLQKREMSLMQFNKVDNNINSINTNNNYNTKGDSNVSLKQRR